MYLYMFECFGHVALLHFCDFTSVVTEIVLNVLPSSFFAARDALSAPSQCQPYQGDGTAESVLVNALPRSHLQSMAFFYLLVLK